LIFGKCKFTWRGKGEGFEICHFGIVAAAVVAVVAVVVVVSVEIFTSGLLNYFSL